MRISDWSSDVCSSDLAAPVDSPGPEAARPGAIDEDVVGDLVGQVELVDETRVLGPLVEVGARRSRDDRPGETARDPGAAAIAVRIAEEADQAVVELVDAAAAGQRQLVGDVQADLAKRGIVAVDAKLLGQPDVAAGAGGRKSVGQGKRVSVRVDLGGRRRIKKKN